ncbi:hypothetical protein WCLP8_5450003 [uncultured Gammaproteobacteria bacterium]
MDFFARPLSLARKYRSLTHLPSVPAGAAPYSRSHAPRRRIGAPAGCDRIAEMAGQVVGGRGQHLGMEIDPAQAGREMELGRSQDLDPIGGIIARSGLVQMIQINLVIAQVKLAVIAGLGLEFQRAVQVARPDREAAVAIGDQNRVIDRDAVGEAHPDPIDRQIAQWIIADRLHRLFAQFLRDFGRISTGPLEQLLAVGAGWRLEQTWSPVTRGADLQHREGAPYLVEIVDGRARVLDYGVRNDDGSWWLASGAPVLGADGAAIAAPTRDDLLAQAHAAGREWRLEAIGYNPLGDLSHPSRNQPNATGY